MKKRIILAIFITLAILSLAALTLSACAVKLVDVTVSGGKNEVYLDEFQLSDYTIEASYSDGTTTRRQLSDEFISPADLAKLTEAGTHTITVTFEGVSVRFTVTLLQRPAHSATMSPQSFVYDGTAHSLQVQGLPQDATVAYQNNGKVNAGEYDVTATVTYSDSTTQTLKAKLTIEKADYDLENITFEGETVTYNGEPHSLKIQGDLPEGVDVSYTGNNVTDAGEHTVTAVFTGDTVNHNPIPSKTAVLKIEKADYDLADITFEGETVTYNGEPHSLKIQGDLPEGVDVSYTGNGVTNAGEHTVTAVFTGDTVNHNPIPSKTAVLKIEKADYDLANITFEGETVTYNGQPHSLSIGGQLPSDVDVSYTGNNVTEIGEHQVTANFTGDTVNHNPIPSKTAVLKIVQPQYSEIKFQDKTVTYNGEPQYLAIEGNLVFGVQVRYENNGQTNVGEYDVKAIFTVPQGYESLPTLTAKLTIEKADYNLADITFEGGTFAYDGEPHSLKIKGDLPKGVEVSYTGNNVTEVGEHQITANFTGDAVNHNPIPSKTAVLTITKRELQVVLDGETVIQYDGKPHNNFTAHATNLVGDETVQISLAYSGNMTDEGTYTVTATIVEHPHYTLTQGNTFQVVIDRHVHTVTFRQDGQPDQTVKVPHFGSISAEQMPEPVQLNDGYTYFWQQTELSNVAEDMTVLADRSPIVYTVTYQTYGGDNPQTNLTQYTVETPLTPLANPTKGQTIFGGWYLNEQFSGAPVQQIGGGMMGNLTLHAYWIEFNVLSVEGFTINEDAEVPTITGEFHNAVTQIDLVNRVVVNNGCVWKLYQDFEGKHEYPLKAMTLTEGHNKAYIIVSHPDGFHFKRYELDVYRMYMRTYRFENLGANYNSGSIEERSAVSAPDSPTRTGYIFDGWTLQGSDSVVQFPYTVNEDTVFTAKYTIINYDITYHLNDEFLDGTFPAQHSNVDSYTVEQLVTLSNATRDHYKFEGWFKEPTFDTQVTELPVGSHENIDLYAKWTAVEYTITYHLNDEFLESTFPAQNPNAETTSYTVESTITLQSATRTAFNFVGWYSEQELQTEVAQLPLGTFGNKDFYAKWTAIEYTITYHLNDDFLDSRFPAVNSDNTVTYTAEGAVTFSNATREHYNFVGWYKEASFDTHVTELPVGTYDDVELYAKWTAVEYNVTYYLNDGTYSNKFPAQNENSATYTVESGLTLQPATRNGFDFVNWYSDEDLETVVNNLPLGTFGDQKLYADWKIATYTITYHLNDEFLEQAFPATNGNKVTSYTIESAINFNAFVSREHYKFVGWYKEPTFDTQVTQLSVGSYGNVDLYAKWTAIEYTVTYHLNDDSKDNLYPAQNENSTTYTVESGLILQPATRNGFAFAGWFDDVDLQNQATDLPLGTFGNKEFWADWEIATYTITYHLNDEDFPKDIPVVNNNTVFSYTIEQSVTFSEDVTHDLYTFCGWYKDPQFGTKITELPVGSYGNVDLYAKWQYGTDGLIYSEQGDDYQVTGYRGSSKSVAIPNVWDGRNVTSIGANAFDGCSSLQEIAIPESVTSIGNNAFENCTNLATVNWNATNCTSVGEWSSSNDFTIFKGCNSLATVNVGANVTSIPTYAFYNCDGLQEITIPENVTSIGNNAFENCTNLATVNWNATNCTSVGEYSSSNDYTIFKGCNSLASVNIGVNVTSIPNYTFYGCSNLAVTFAEGCQLDSISAFYGLEGLQSLNNIPANVTAIDSSAFYGCSNLTTVTFAEGSLLETIGENTFRNCSSLQEITIPENVTSIGNKAFADCTNLATVNWNATNCTSVGQYESYSYDYTIFKGCTNLATVNIGANVTSVPAYAFYNCEMTKVSFADGSQLQTIGSSAFEDCSSLQEITIPANVTTIDSSAFYGCSKLAMVTFAEESLLETIGKYAFYKCSSLQQITIPANVTSIGYYAFDGCSNLATVTFAEGCQLDSISEFYGLEGLQSLNNIPANVTTIGSRAFKDCSNLATVTFADGSLLETIGSGAFSGCINLTTVTFADGSLLETISGGYNYNDGAFNGCSSLQEITIPTSVTSIGDYAFRGCSNLTTVTFADGSLLKNIGEYAFYDCSRLQQITIPANVTSIDDYAFRNCTNLTTVNWNATNCTSVGSSSYYAIFKGCTGLATVNIGANVTSIGSDAFYDCSSLNEVNITDIDAWSNIDFGNGSANPLYYAKNLYLNDELVTEANLEKATRIGSYAFYGYDKLTNVTIPASVTSIGSSAFYGCNSLAIVTFAEGCQLDSISAFYYLKGLQSLNNIPVGVTSIGNQAFNGCSNLTTVTFADGSLLETIGSYAFRSCSSLKEITIPANVTSIGYEAFGGCSNLATVTFADGSLLQTIGEYAFSYCSRLQEITIPANVTSIGSDAFYKCSSLQEITIPASVTSIDGSAFSGCSNLATVTFAEGCQLDSIGAFYGLTGLQSLNNIPANVTSIGSRAFSGCSKLVTVTFADGSLLETIGSSAFYNCTSLQEIIIPASVTSIGSDAFSGCSNLTTVTFADGSLLETISEYAFYECSSLQEITIPANVTSIGYAAFSGCTNLATINWNATNCTSAGRFSGCTSLTTVNIGANVTSILENTFDNCRSLVTVTFADGSLLETIGSYAFRSCSSLQEITIPASVTSIGYGAFSGCSNLTTVTFADGSQLQTIGEYAFSGCSSLQEITIPANVTTIGSSAFSGCSSLKRVNITDIDAWCNIDFNGSTANPLSYAKNLYLNDELVTEANLEEATQIGILAFYGCDKLTKVTIAASVTSIGYEAFSGCSNLATVTFADGSLLETIGGGNNYGEGAFSNCSSLQEITIPASVTSIGGGAFYGCSNLATVTFADGSLLKTIGYEAFDGCSSLQEITIPASVTSIGRWAFEYCSNLNKVNITDIDAWCNIDFGGYYANPLYYAKNLYLNDDLVTSVNIPSEMTQVKPYIFCNCVSLQEVTISASVTSIGSSAFYGCSGLDQVNITDINAWCNIDFGDSDANPLNNGADLYLNGDIVTSVTIPAEMTQVKKYIFRGCTSLQEVTIPANVTSIGENAFDGCNSLNRVNITDIDAWCNIDFGNMYANPLNNGADLYLNGDLVTSVTIPAEMMQVNPYIFNGCTSLQKVTIPASVTSIGSYAFYGCSSLQEITIPENVTSIGDNAFANCTNLATVNWNATNCTSVGRYDSSWYDYTIFKGCTSLATVNVGANVTAIAAYAFYGCSSLNKVNITDIDAWCNIDFSSSSANPLSNKAELYLNGDIVTSVTIPANVTSIGSYTFYGCSNLATVTIADESLLQTIGNYAFCNCTSLQEITIPANVTSIGSSAFKDCSNLTTVTFADGSLLETIGGGSYNNGAFDRCSSLQEITIPASVTSIGDYAFENCSNLATVTFADGSLLETIGNYAFFYCKSLQEITIPASVTSIGSWAFYGCYSLQTVYCGGTQTQWGQISIGDYNSALTSAEIYYYSADKPDGSELPVGRYWRYVDGKPTVWKEEDQ